jgi:hypothetical protein
VVSAVSLPVTTLASPDPTKFGLKPESKYSPSSKDKRSSRLGTFPKRGAMSEEPDKDDHKTAFQNRPYFVEKRRWQFSGQLGSLAMSRGEDSSPLLVVAQPSGVFITIDSCGNMKDCIGLDSRTMTETQGTSLSTIDITAKSTLEVSTELISGVKTQSKFKSGFLKLGCYSLREQPDSQSPDVIALCTMDGKKAASNSAGPCAP